MRSSVPNLRAATNKGEQDLQVCLSQVMHGGLCGAQRLMSCTVACVNVAVFLRGAQVLNSFLA